MRDYQALAKAALVAHRNGATKEFAESLSDEEREILAAGVGLDMDRIKDAFLSLTKTVQEEVVPAFMNFAMDLEKILAEDPAFQQYLDQCRKIENAKLN